MKEKTLETLKDIENHDCLNHVDRDKVKVLAIKWVKEFFPFNPKGQIFSAKDFRKFANITEEDLK